MSLCTNIISHKELAMSIAPGSEVEVIVYADKHANLDSFPLRYGFYFAEDTVLKLKIRGPGKTSLKQGRQVYFVEFENPELNQIEEGEAVISDHQESGFQVLITIWRGDVETEHYLSSVMRNLRESGDIDSDWLKSMHRYYQTGQLSTHSDLVRHLVASQTISETSGVKARADQAVEQVEREIATAHQEIRQLKEELEESRAEVARHKEVLSSQNLERATATRKGSKVATTDGVVLQEVVRNVMHRGSSCTILKLNDGSERYMKTSTFDPNGLITQKAESLIGLPVRVTHWDPIDRPGLWSSQGYFRDIYPD